MMAGSTAGGGGSISGGGVHAGPLVAREQDWRMPAAHQNLRLSSHAPLEAAAGRAACPRCGRSRFLFCCDCLVALTADVPRVQLVSGRED